MVETLIYHGKLANQIARLPAIVVKTFVLDHLNRRYLFTSIDVIFAHARKITGAVVGRSSFDLVKSVTHRRISNRPRSMYQYSSMAPGLSGQTSIFGVVFFVSKSLLGIERQKKL